MENNPVPEQPAVQPPIQQVSQTNSSGSKLRPILLMILLLVIVGVGAYLLGTKDIFTSKNIATNPATIPTSIPSPSINPSMTHFKDARLQGMEFNYDPQIWSVELQQGGGGIAAINRNNQDVLGFRYVFMGGVGGGVSTFKQSDLGIIDDYWSRIKTNNGTNLPLYLYGLKKNLIYHSQNKAEKDQLIELFCPGTGDGLLSDEVCNEIKSGIIIGHVDQPRYSWGFRLKRLVPLAEMTSSLEISYIEKSGGDDGYTTVEITYHGNNPEEADKIVKQLRGI